MAMTKCRECQKDVSTEAESCPNCGVTSPGGATAASSKSFKMEPVKMNQNVGGAGTLAFLLLVAVGGAFYYFAPGSTALKPDATLGAVDTLAGGTLTMAKFNQLQNGMSYNAAVQIIGEPGKEMSRTDLGGFSTILYMWQNPSGANMNATFQNGKMVNKTQFGLN